MVTLDAWEKVRLGDLGVTYGGLSGKSSPDFGNGDAAYVTFMNVIENVVLRLSGTDRVRVRPGESQSRLRAGDVIFNGSSETPDEVGLGSAVPGELEGTHLNSFCFGFRPHPGAQLDARFFAYLTRSPAGRAIIRPMAQGSTRYNLAKTNLLNGHFFLPAIKEQETIAEALGSADAAIEALDALIAKKRDVKQAAMQQLLSGRARRPGFTGDWGQGAIGSLFSFHRTIALSRAQLSDNAEIGYIHYGDIHAKWGTHLDLSRESLPRAEPRLAGSATLVADGDLVLADASEDIEGVGRAVEVCGVGQQKVVAGLHTVLLRPRVGVFASGYVGLLSETPEFRLQARTLAAGLKVYGLSKSSLRQIVVRVPPLKEQEAIAGVLLDMDGEIEALVAQREKTRLVKKGMMQELLSGRVRLV